MRNNHRVGDTNSNHVMNRSVLNNIRLNILLTLILIPTVIFILTLIGCTLWYWRRKFRLERHRLDFSNSVKLSGAASAAAANRDENKETSSNASITIIENTATVASNDGILQNRATSNSLFQLYRDRDKELSFLILSNIKFLYEENTLFESSFRVKFHSLNIIDFGLD